MGNNEIDMLHTVKDFYSRACRDLGLEKVMEKYVITPERILEVNMPVRMDDGDLRIFRSYRVQHNDALGPHKGGIRFHPSVNRDECLGLAMLMSIKGALAHLPYGGGKGGIRLDPKKLSRTELERVSRNYVRENIYYLGVSEDIPAPDVNTNPQIMAWMADEYKKLTNSHLAAFTGKPHLLGGSKGRVPATGLGGMKVLQYFIDFIRKEEPDRLGCVNLEKNIKERIGQDGGMTVAIHGFGNVGYHLARFLHREGYLIVAVSDSKGAIYCKEGLDPLELHEHQQQHGQLPDEINGATRISNKDLLALDVDILAPSALENTIDENNMKDVKAAIILEMANGPLSLKADQYLSDKGRIILPDVLANSGGVIVSFFEMVQNKQNYQWSLEKVESELENVIRKSADRLIRKNLESDGEPLRLTAYKLAIERIVRAFRTKN